MRLGIAEMSATANRRIQLSRDEWKLLLKKVNEIEKYRVVSDRFQKNIINNLRAAVQSRLGMVDHDPLIIYLTGFEEAIVESLVTTGVE